MVCTEVRKQRTNQTQHLPQHKHSYSPCTHIYSYILTRTLISAPTCQDMCKHLYEFLHASTYLCMCTHILSHAYSHALMCTLMHTHSPPHIHVHSFMSHTLMHTHPHRVMYTHTHAYMHTPSHILTHLYTLCMSHMHACVLTQPRTLFLYLCPTHFPMSPTKTNHFYYSVSVSGQGRGLLPAPRQLCANGRGEPSSLAHLLIQNLSETSGVKGAGTATGRTTEKAMVLQVMVP